MQQLRESQMPHLGDTSWDQIYARSLYDRMVGYAEIGRAVGASGSQINSFAARHWPKRDESLVRKARKGPAPKPAQPRKAQVLKKGARTLPQL